MKYKLNNFRLLYLVTGFLFIIPLSCFFKHGPEKFDEIGNASWYGKDFHGKITSSGERYDMFKFTAAHKTLPLGTKVEVTNLSNGRKVKVYINDRGPFVEGRIIDLSYAAALKLGMVKHGTTKVRIKILKLGKK